MAHLREHSFTGSTDHNFTGLVSGQSLIFDGTGIISTGSTSTSGNLWSASTGSGSIIANNGSGNLASEEYTFVTGFNNTASGKRSSVTGGYNNMASGDYGSVVVGGYNNTASGNYGSGVLGGSFNSASTYNSGIIGGQQNTASGAQSVVAGGTLNKASGAGSFVGAGNSNSATTTNSAIVGGQQNTASGLSSGAIAGSGNTVSGTRSAIIGGQSLTNSFDDTLMTMNARLAESGGVIYSAGTDLYNIFGAGGTSADLWSASTGTGSIIANNGTGNLASGDYSLSFGNNNQSTSNLAISIGGSNNEASGIGSFLAGGSSNSATTTLASVVAGSQNIASGIRSSILGGRTNTASGDYSMVGAGQNNISSGNHANIIGGQNNLASGNKSSVIGSYSSSATTGYGTVLGSYMSIASGFYSSIMGSSYATANSSRSTVIGSDASTASDFRTSVISSTNSTANGDTSSILASSGSTVSGKHSAIIGGSGMTNTFDDTFMTINARLAENGGVIYSAGTDLYNIFAAAGTTSESTTASNGLTESGNNITLGGALTGDTYIDNSSFLFRTNEFSATTMSAQTIHVANLSGFSPININDTMHVEENANVGIGTTSPFTQFEVVGDAGTNAITITKYVNTNAAGRFYGRKARGTESSPSGVTIGDSLLNVASTGYHSGGAFHNNTAAIQFEAAEDFTDSSKGGTKIVFGTSSIGTANSTIDRMKVEADGGVSVFYDFSGGTGGVIYSGGTDLYNIFGAAGSGISKFAGSSAFTASVALQVDHNLGTTDVVVQVRDSSGEVIYPDVIDNFQINSVDIEMSSTDTYRVIITG